MVHMSAVHIYHNRNKGIKPTMVLWNIKILLTSSLTLLATAVSTNLLSTPSINKNILNIYKILTKTLNDCYPGNLNPLIVSNLSQHLRDYSNLDYPMSLILMNEHFNYNDTLAQWTNYHPTSPTFVVLVDSLEQLHETMKRIFFSIWNSNEPHFIIVDLDSCHRATRALGILWKGKFLSAVFLCHHHLEDAFKFYTFNPFTDLAPDPWTKAENEGSWTLYERNYQEDEGLCLNLNYDKTRDLGGYKITAVGIPKPGIAWIPDMNYDVSSLTEKLPYFNAQFARNIFLKINTTASIHYSQSLQFGKYQFFMTSYHPTQFGRGIYKSYPFRQSSSVIMTQKRPFLSTEDKILSFYSFLIVLCIILSFSSLFIALMLNRKQPCSSALLEVMRLLLATGLLQPLNKLPLRIYLFGIFWLAIILSATFQGNLAKFLTRPERQSVDSLTDLKNFKYKVYVNSGSFPSVSLALFEMQQSASVLHDLNGYQIVLNDSRAAYITADFRAYEPAYKHQLHVSSPCSFSYQCFLTSLPISRRINEISSRYAESGLQDYWDKYAVDRYKTNLTNTEELETSPRVRPLTIADVLFMFKFLAVGLGLSFLTLLMEMTVKIKHQQRVN